MYATDRHAHAYAFGTWYKQVFFFANHMPAGLPVDI